MEKPLVSVVIPFYENKKWLKEALLSVQNQTYKNIEVIVINDGSKEDISKFNQLFELNLRIINKENGGPASARNLGIKVSKGKYIAFLDSDDIWLPLKLEKQINEMEINGYKWSQHSYEMFWENTKKTKIRNTEIYKGDVYKDTFISFRIQTSCVVVLRNVLIENKICFPEEKRYGQDGLFYKQLAKNYPLGYVDGVLSRFRIRGTNAGFRAKIQINGRANGWNNIKNDHDILKLLPKGVILAYKLSSYLNKFVVFIDKRILKEKNEKKIIELISKFMYVLPYSLFKLYSRRR